MSMYLVAKDWCNGNSGFLTLILFIATIALGWITGIFKALSRKTILHCNLLDGPTVFSTFESSEKFRELSTYRSACSLYLSISNMGFKATTIRRVIISYKRDVDINPFDLKTFWEKISVKFFYKSEMYETVSLQDFTVTIGDNLKVYPYLNQQSMIIPGKSSGRFLREGELKSGVVYFEDIKPYWGKFHPMTNKDFIKVKVTLVDTFHKKTSFKFKIPVMPIEKIREKFNAKFGLTHECMVADAISEESIVKAK